MRRVFAWIGIVLMLSSLSAAAVRAQSTLVDSTVYLPLVMRNYNPLAGQRQVNAPYIANLIASSPQHPGWVIQYLTQMTIFWFGKVTASENYTDVRAAYSDTELVLYITVFDRLIWQDVTPSAASLTQWDALTLYLDRDGNVGGVPDTNAYRFVIQYGAEENYPQYQAAYRGNGSGWAAQSLAFTTFTVDRWETGGSNSGLNSRGWVATVRIPFSTLGVAKPANGVVWGMGLVNHDRDSEAGPPLADKAWPETVEANNPSSWGRLRFGMPAYSPPASNTPQTITIREGLNGAVVPDANLGGAIEAQCPGDSNYIWNEWGNRSYPSNTGANIQNQSDAADWPCFAKYYVTFPLAQLPAGKVIRSATFTLNHWSNSGGVDVAKPSYIHVLTVGTDWNENTLTWNNAPLPLENVANAWVPVYVDCGSWTCAPRNWDVSRAVASAYAAGQPLRLAVYSSDSDYHSGKYFSTSETEDWNALARPKLTIEYGTP